MMNRLTEKLYRYTANGEGVFRAGKKLLPQELVDEAWENRKWLPKPNLSQGDYRFYLTPKGREQYEKTLLNTHKKYLTNIKMEEVDRKDIGEVVYEDEWQVVTKSGI